MKELKYIEKICPIYKGEDMTIRELDYSRIQTKYNKEWPTEELKALPKWEIKRNKARLLREEADRLEKDADELEKYEKYMIQEYGI